ncbi:MAG: hypothetical protein J0H68_03425 [Sphingobacteriia bacterium]|nr:hypothetical protein [Sphingobacteriia bacterium]
MISYNFPINSTEVSFNELKAKLPNLPYEVPENKNLRIIQIGNLNPVPCGGTHITNINEIKEVKIIKIKKNKIFYEVI